MYAAIVVLIILQDILTIFIIRGMRADNIKLSLENHLLKNTLCIITEELNKIGSEIDEKDKQR